MKSKTTSYLLLCALFLSITPLSANYAFKKKVKDVCKSYRIVMESSQMNLEENMIQVKMESGRNNFEMFMLVGFASVGEAISHQKEMNLSNSYTPNQVTVSVNVPISRGEYNTFIAKCNANMAISLAQGQMDSSEFMQEIMKNMEIQ
mgnify:CR=1 FL=1